MIFLTAMTSVAAQEIEWEDGRIRGLAKLVGFVVVTAIFVIVVGTIFAPHWWD